MYGAIKFESIFDYKDDYAAKALLTIKQIKEKKLLSNIDIFNKFCTNDEFMIKKLAKIYQENKIEAVHKNFKRFSNQYSLDLRVYKRDL